MAATKINISIVSSSMLPDDVLMLGEAFMRQWKMIPQQRLTLRFGAFQHGVTLVPVPRYDGLRISQTLARRMGIQVPVALRVRYHAALRTLALGPLIGVLVSRSDPLQPDRPFRDITRFCRELTDAGRANGAFIYFFTPGSIGTSASTVEGWVYNGGWNRLTLPAPDVVNNRLTMRKLENQPRVQQFMAEIKHRFNSQVFNEKFLDKSEVFDALKKDSSLHKYLPDSHHFTSFAQLKRMCGQYQTVFLKPVRGSLGKGIIRISRSGTDGWQASYATLNGTKRVHFSNLEKLFASLSGSRKMLRYQIQQGLLLIETQGRPVDFRALTQKNGTGKWSITSIVGRTAGNRHFVSNLARGGSLATVHDSVMRSNLPASLRKGASARLQKAALDISRGIDTLIPAHFAELGVDLAMDPSGRVWLLEVNSKPSKNDNTPLREGKIRPSVRIMLHYARYISGF